MITNTEIDLMEEKFEELKDLEFLACQVICVTNDIFSAEKEGLHGDPNNLVFIYMNRDSIDIVEASQRAADLSQQSIDLFEEIFDKLENKYDSIPENLLKYIDGLRMWMIGNTEWSRFCSRYQSKNLQDLDL
jgi:hypothetical protein